MTNVTTARFQLGGSLIFWCKKTRGIYDNCDPRHLYKVITCYETWLHDWTWEKSTGRGMGAKRRKATWNGKISLTRRYCIWYSSTLLESCYKNHMMRGTALLGNTAESVFLLRSTFFFRRESNWILACVVSHLFIMMHLLTRASSSKSISQVRTLKLCFTLPTPLTWHLVNFSWSHTSKNAFVGEGSTQDHPSDQPFSSIFYNIPRIELKLAFLLWEERLSVLQEMESTLKSCSHVWWGQHTHKSEAPSYEIKFKQNE